jgi:head-tail adaptor
MTFAANGLFTRTYEHWRETQTPDGAGGFVTTWNKLADVEGRAYPRTQSEEAIGGRMQGKVTWVFAAPAGTDLQVGDEIRFSGRVLKVREQATTSTGRRLEAECEEMQP